MERKKPEPYEIYRHFKNNLYQVLAIAKHSETGEELVIYQALYGTYGIYARPLGMFMSEVDHEKYPLIKQKYRFEKAVPGQNADAGISMSEIPAEVQAQGKAEIVPETMPETEPVPEKTENEEEEEIFQDGERPNPDLMEFLDADTFEQKKRILIGMRNRITDRLIDDLAAALDVTVEDGDLDERFRNLLICVDTMERFEVTRLR